MDSAQGSECAKHSDRAVMFAMDIKERSSIGLWWEGVIDLAACRFYLQLLSCVPATCATISCWQQRSLVTSRGSQRAYRPREWKRQQSPPLSEFRRN